MTEHTKLPWEIRLDEKTGLPRIAGPKQDNGLHQVVALFPILQEKEIIEANAEYLVLAVNSHEGLVEVKEKAQALLNFIKEKYPDDFKPGGRGYICPHHIALAEALAAVEGDK
jgi:hypothetical protein